MLAGAGGSVLRSLLSSSGLALSVALAFGPGCAEPTCDPEVVQLSSYGVDFAAWDGVADSTAGDFKFACVGCPDDPTYQMKPFGEVEPEKGARGSIDFWPAAGVEIVAPVGGVISRHQLQEPDQDYEIEIETEGGCQVYFDHLLEPTVELGDTVAAGDPMGTAGAWNSDAGLGLIEISVQSGDVQYCPTMFVTDDDQVAGLSQLMEDVEQLTGDSDVYDEAAMPFPGCVAEQNEAS
jgi:hypothetical protein